MLTIARLFLLRWLAARTLGGVVGTTLAAALPVAALLKLVGLPLLAVVGTIGAPVALVLALLGLPLLLVLAVVGIVIAVATAAAMLALAVLKYVLPALLIGWLVARLFRTLRRRTAEAEARHATAPAAAMPIDPIVSPFEAPVEGPAA
jgi:hypothetical protein